jgi:hypothetical protein
VLPPLAGLCLHGLDRLLRQIGVACGNHSSLALHAFGPAPAHGRNSAELSLDLRGHDAVMTLNKDRVPFIVDLLSDRLSPSPQDVLFASEHKGRF